VKEDEEHRLDIESKKEIKSRIGRNEEGDHREEK
jgi:hypothetical protein